MFNTAFRPCSYTAFVSVVSGSPAGLSDLNVASYSIYGRICTRKLQPCTVPVVLLPVLYSLADPGNVLL